jgi:hypothetical protein
MSRTEESSERLSGLTQNIAHAGGRIELIKFAPGKGLERTMHGCRLEQMRLAAVEVLFCELAGPVAS